MVQLVRALEVVRLKAAGFDVPEQLSPEWDYLLDACLTTSSTGP